jgi:hypothetical protein
MNWLQRRSVWAVFCIAPLLGACDAEMILEEWWFKGTTKGVSLCKARGTDQGVSNNTIQEVCVKKHQKLIHPSVDGTAGFAKDIGVAYFRGSLENKSTDYVITSYTISVTHKSAPDKTTIKAFEHRWVEPHESNYFYIENNDLKFKPEKPEDFENDSLDWSIPTILGVQISF